MSIDGLPKEMIDFGRSQGILLSVAKSISDTRKLPKPGQQWRVDVYIADCSQEPVRQWHEYSWDVNLTAIMIQQASIFARRCNYTKPLMGWCAARENFVIHLKTDFPGAKPLRTSEEQMKDLALDLEDTCRDWLSDLSNLPLLDFCYSWDHHIPSDTSRDFYRGFCHGIRIALDICFAFQRQFPNSTGFRLLEELYRYLAGRAAECYFKGYSKRPAIPASASFKPLTIRERVTPPFRISWPEIEQLSLGATQELINKSGPLQPDAQAQAGDPPSAPSIEAGESTVFYEGVLHATKLNQQITSAYEEWILPHPLYTYMSLAKGAHQLSCVVARHWKKATVRSAHG